MDQLDVYLAEQRAHRVAELEEQNFDLRCRLQDGGGAAPMHAATAPTRAIGGGRGSLRRRLAEAEARIRELEDDLNSVLTSRSWRFLRLIGIAKR